MDFISTKKNLFLASDLYVFLLNFLQTTNIRTYSSKKLKLMLHLANHRNSKSANAKPNQAYAFWSNTGKPKIFETSQKPRSRSGSSYAWQYEIPTLSLIKKTFRWSKRNLWFSSLKLSLMTDSNSYQPPGAKSILNVWRWFILALFLTKKWNVTKKFHLLLVKKAFFRSSLKALMSVFGFYESYKGLIW